MTRLGAVQSLIVLAHTIADVGCDHGKIAEYCVESGKAVNVIASDISEKCLDKARAAIKNSVNVTYICCDGIDYECDEAVIAGMGGYTICGIIEAARVLPGTLVLLPHRDADAVRRTLYAHGYEIERDFIVKERNKFYSAMRAVLAETETRPTELQYMFGMFCAEKDELLSEYLVSKYNSYIVAPTRNRSKLLPLCEALRLQGITADGTEIIRR